MGLSFIKSQLVRRPIAAMSINREAELKNNTVADDYVSVKLFGSKKGDGHDFFIYS